MTETTYERNDLLLLTVPEALFAMAVGRHGKAEFMMAGVCDRVLFTSQQTWRQREIDRNQELL